ncbi:MAG: hypothetical protein AB8C84_05395 [Oligoflexales bacterium]
MKRRLLLGIICVCAQYLHAQKIFIESNSFSHILLIRLEGFQHSTQLSAHSDEACLSSPLSQISYQNPHSWVTISHKNHLNQVFIKTTTKQCLASPFLPLPSESWVERGFEHLPESTPEGQFHLKDMIETHTIPTPKNIDLLWVIDSSGSMAEEQQFLSNQFIHFSQNLKNSGRNFRMAVTTTDICTNTIPNNLTQRACPISYGGNQSTQYQGRFVGPILNSDDSQLPSLFQDQALVGTSGSGFEHGLKAVDLALHKSETGENPHYPATESFLSIIIISDEEDDGIGLRQVDAYSGINYTEAGKTSFYFPPSQLTSTLTDKFGVGQFSLSAITGTRNSDGELCSSPHSQPKEEGTAIIKAAHLTGGVVHSICEANWDTLLNNLANDVQTQSDQIILEETPILSTLKVFHNDQQILWDYLPQLNALRLHSSNMTPGDNLRIEYRTLHLNSIL